ncbi:tRNA threonylcarbamoyladenosine biosynthesis protein RimN, partial [Vibrio parahaemolyticus]|nr:tRNA threonylcarbamoyladenosine biosynthesis protein RimN [Vibrio parahaemolyticus]
MPEIDKVSIWVSGLFDSFAVRVTYFPLVLKMCIDFGNHLTSTSAIVSCLAGCMTTVDVVQQ